VTVIWVSHIGWKSSELRRRQKEGAGKMERNFLSCVAKENISWSFSSLCLVLPPLLKDISLTSVFVLTWLIFLLMLVINKLYVSAQISWKSVYCNYVSTSHGQPDGFCMLFSRSLSLLLSLSLSLSLYSSLSRSAPAAKSVQVSTVSPEQHR